MSQPVRGDPDVLCAQDGPDHSTIARFRADGRDAFTALSTPSADDRGSGRAGPVRHRRDRWTKIAANASIDANRGQDWFDRQTQAMVNDAERVDSAADAAASNVAEETYGDRVPSQFADGSHRAERIHQA